KPLRPLHLEVKRDHYTERLSDALDRFLIYYGELKAKVLTALQPEPETADLL
ncbi:hypothetical protein JIN85_21195, partial [Luteolibacter pohnpeiensis]|nr:hypothetical protein [Luteolibacter pohnpeiensis]